MTIITVPKTITKGDELVIISRKDYELLLGFPQKRQAKVAKPLDENLKEALEDVEAGRVIGPFSSLKQGLQALKRAK